MGQSASGECGDAWRFSSSDISAPAIVAESVATSAMDLKDKNMAIDSKFLADKDEPYYDDEQSSRIATKNEEKKACISPLSQPNSIQQVSEVCITWGTYHQSLHQGKRVCDHLPPTMNFTVSKRLPKQEFTTHVSTFDELSLFSFFLVSPIYQHLHMLKWPPALARISTSLSED
jgi:hypothetical protein